MAARAGSDFTLSLAMTVLTATYTTSPDSALCRPTAAGRSGAQTFCDRRAATVVLPSWAGWRVRLRSRGRRRLRPRVRRGSCRRTAASCGGMHPRPHPNGRIRTMEALHPAFTRSDDLLRHGLLLEKAGPNACPSSRRRRSRQGNAGADHRRSSRDRPPSRDGEDFRAGRCGQAVRPSAPGIFPGWSRPSKPWTVRFSFHGHSRTAFQRRFSSSAAPTRQIGMTPTSTCRPWHRPMHDRPRRTADPAQRVQMLPGICKSRKATPSGTASASPSASAASLACSRNAVLSPGHLRVTGFAALLLQCANHRRQYARADPGLVADAWPTMAASRCARGVVILGAQAYAHLGDAAWTRERAQGFSSPTPSASTA